MDYFVDIKKNLLGSDSLSILAESGFDPTPERLRMRAEKHMSNPKTRAYALQRDGLCVGIIVLDTGDPARVEILDFAVKKNLQKQGVGSTLIRYCINAFRPALRIAETDDDAVGFYRQVGFSIEPLGNKYGSGANRYLCTMPV